MGNSIVRKSKESKKEKGLVPEIAKKKGKVLVTDIAESVAAFYEDDQFSRNCPGKKGFVSVRINSEKVHKQKCLLLVNLKEFKSSKSHAKKICFSKFCELCLNGAFLLAQHQTPIRFVSVKFIKMPN